MEHLHLTGIRFIQWLQQFKALEPILTNVSRVGSPPMAYALVFSAAYYVNPLLGLLTMLCTCSSEWISGVMKWVLFGHRPYWWVEIYAERTRTAPLYLEQFPATCETGPGSPSGHCMITLAAILPLLLYTQPFLPRAFASKYLCFGQRLLWILFSIFAILLGLSRLFLAAHFPHQVVTGIISGITMGYLFMRLSQVVTLATKPGKAILEQPPISTLVKWLNHPTPLLLFGIGSFFLAWLFSWCLENIVGININWSIDLAKMACRRSEWVHLSTSLMVGFARIAGYLSGLALALLMYPPPKSLLLQSDVGISVLFSSCIAAFITKVLAEPACSLLVLSCLTKLLPTTNDGGPGTALLFTSVVEGATGPLMTVWILPFLSASFASLAS